MQRTAGELAWPAIIASLLGERSLSVFPLRSMKSQKHLLRLQLPRCALDKWANKEGINTMQLKATQTHLLILPILGAVSSFAACGAVLDVRPPTLGANAGINVGNSSREALPSPNVSEVRLQDFVVEASDGNVEICVWDNQCEDGDVVRVGVAGQSYQVKLLTEKTCRQFALGAGTHAIELYAVNGTGFEGQCDFTDVNSGAITVGPVSQPGQRQEWLHQGGTGSSARIHVAVR